MKFFILLLFHVSSLWLIEGQYVLHSKQGKPRQEQHLNNGWKEVQPNYQQQQLNNNFWNRPQNPVTPNYFMKPAENNVYQWPLYQHSVTPASPQKIPVYQNNMQNPFDPQNIFNNQQNWNKPVTNPQQINNHQFNQQPSKQWQHFTPPQKFKKTTTISTTTTTTTTPASLDLNKLFNQHKQNQHQMIPSMNYTSFGGGPRIIIDNNCMKCLCFIESWCSDVGCVMDEGM
jgi:hypothetical protein